MTTQSRTLPPATAAARVALLLLALAGLAIAIGSQWLWRHRRQIGSWPEQSGRIGLGWRTLPAPMA